MKKYVLLLLITIQIYVECLSDYARYDNYHMYSLIVGTEEQMDVVNALENYSDSYTVLEKTLSGAAKVIVPPHKFGEFRDLLAEHSFQFLLLSENVQDEINTEKTRMRTVRTEFNWNEYHRLDTIYKWMENLAVKYPDNLTLISVGKSYEGRDIKSIKLSYKTGNPGIILEAGLHAREWIAPAVVTYILNQLIYSKDEQVRLIAESYDWYIIPVANPDGYEYTHTGNRFWRKTRKPYFFVCRGADPNRNWDHHWGEQGASSFPCADSFKGDKPFSEVETESMARYFRSIQGKIQSYIAFHSFSQLILFPYGYTSKHAHNHDDLQNIGNKAAQALGKRYGTVYTVGNTHETLYAASGSSMEWAYDILGTKISYTYELRPSSSPNIIPLSGFSLSPQQIVPTGEETLDSLVALFSEAKKMGYP